MARGKKDGAAATDATELAGAAIGQRQEAPRGGSTSQAMLSFRSDVDHELMTTWATVSVSKGVRPPDPPARLDFPAVVADAVQFKPGQAQSGSDVGSERGKMEATAGLQLQGRGVRKQGALFPGFSERQVAELSGLLPGKDIIGCNLGGNYLGDEAVKSLAVALQKCPRLSTLSLTHNAMTGEACECVVSCVLPAEMPWDPKPNDKVAKSVSLLTSSLRHRYHPGDNPAITALTPFGSAEHNGEWLAAARTAVESVVSSTSQLPPAEPYGLCVLALSNNMVGDRGAAAVAAALARPNCPLVTLHLAGNFITDVGAEQLGAVCADNNMLQTLNLTGNKISNGGVADLKRHLTHNTALHTLGLAYNPIFQCVDKDGKKPDLVEFSSAAYKVKSNRHSSAISFTAIYTNARPDDPIERLKLSRSRTPKWSPVATGEPLLDLHYTGTTGGGFLNVKHIAVPVGATPSSPEPAELGPAVWSAEHVLLAELMAQLAGVPTKLASQLKHDRIDPRSFANRMLRASQLERATYDPADTPSGGKYIASQPRSDARAMMRRARALIRVDVKRADGRSNRELMGAATALLKAMELEEMLMPGYRPGHMGPEAGYDSTEDEQDMAELSVLLESTDDEGDDEGSGHESVVPATDSSSVEQISTLRKKVLRIDALEFKAGSKRAARKALEIEMMGGPLGASVLKPGDKPNPGGGMGIKYDGGTSFKNDGGATFISSTVAGGSDSNSRPTTAQDSESPSRPNTGGASIGSGGGGGSGERADWTGVTFPERPTTAEISSRPNTAGVAFAADFVDDNGIMMLPPRDSDRPNTAGSASSANTDRSIGAGEPYRSRPGTRESAVRPPSSNGSSRPGTGERACRPERPSSQARTTSFAAQSMGERPESRPGSVMSVAIDTLDWGEAWPTQMEISGLLRAVNVELSIPIEARQARHAADEHFRAQRWHDGLAAYEEALSLKHTKEVHCRSQSARCLIQIADQLMRNSDGGKQKKTARLKNTIRTAQKSVTNLGAAHNIKFNAAVHELELAVAAAGGPDVTAVPYEFTANPGDDGTKELSEVLKLQAMLLYRLKHMRGALVACQRALVAMPDDEDLLDMEWEIGKRL